MKIKGRLNRMMKTTPKCPNCNSSKDMEVLDYDNAEGTEYLYICEKCMTVISTKNPEKQYSFKNGEII